MPVQGQEPFREDLEWLKFGRDTIRESPKVLDEAARSFLALGSSFLTVYTGALTILKLTEKATGPLSWAVICVPILLWLSCISCFAYVYFPDRIKFHANSPSDIERVTREISRKKSKRLKIGSVLFVAALAATSFSIVWLGAQPEKEKIGDEQPISITAEDGAITIKNLSWLPQEADMRILPLVLLSQENQTSPTQTQGVAVPAGNR